MTAVRAAGPAVTEPGRRRARLLAVVALPPAVVAAVIGVLAQGVILLVVLFVVVGVGVVVLVRARAAGRSVDLGATAADPVRHARFVNLVEGLCVRAGVRMPPLGVVAAGGCNLAVVGRDGAHASLVVTAGLLDQLSRMELEGALALGVVELRRGDPGPATLAAAVGPPAVRLAVDPSRDTIDDDAAVALTRYPPGLIAALRKLEQHGTEVPGTPARLAHLWLADPTPAPAGPVAYRRSLHSRIDALAEL